MSVLATIAYQDFKDRMVWWFLFPLLALSGGYLYYSDSLAQIYGWNVIVNLLLVGIILLVLFFYTRLRSIKFKEAFGLGDTLFLGAFALSFPVLSFLNFLVFSVLFSLGVYVIVLRKKNKNTIPFAGTMAIFLMGVYLASWFGLFNSIYL